MNSSADRFLQTEAIFHEVVVLAEPERTLLLETRCGSDTALMQEIRALLEACELEEIHRRASQHEPQTVAEVPQRIGPYQLRQLLGRGGMGAVYLAERVDGQFEQKVALKLIDLPLATDLFRNRFRLERQILAGLSHPYIARLLDGGVSAEGDLYLVMEYIDGISIVDFCRQRSLGIHDRLQLFQKVCEAVQYAHQNLVVHRDLKPDNILVDEAGNPHLLDFGTAKLLSPVLDSARDLTQAGVQIFTPRYASPEQVMGQPISIASDIYSLGVLLYVLLTDVPPYELSEFTTEEMIRVICGQQPGKPSSTDAPYGKLDNDLDSIVLKALRKEPEQRYATVAEMASDIQAYLQQRPVSARRGNWRYLATKFVRRNTIPLVAASLLLFSLVAGAIVVGWQAHVATVQRRKAEARSKDLRLLSESLLSELDDAIKELPGSTPAQKLLVTRVLEHLDRMSADGADDQLTQLDVASAYTRIANLQGNAYDQNIGDAAGGVASINKAIGITEHLKAQHPKDPAVLHAYALAQQSRGEILFGMANLPEAILALKDGAVIFGEVASLPGATSLQLSEAATAYGGLGDVLGQPGRVTLSDTKGALDAYRTSLAFQQKALETDPTSVRARRSLPLSMTKIGNIEFDTDPWQARRQYQASMKAMENYPADLKKSFAYIRTSDYIARKYATTQTETGDEMGAIATIESLLPAMRSYLKADPTDDRAQEDVEVYLESEARAYESLLNPVLHPADEGRTRYRQRAIELLQQMSDNLATITKRNPNDKTSRATLANLQMRLAALQQETSQHAQAVALAGQGLATLCELAVPADAPVYILDNLSTGLLGVQGLLGVSPADTVVYAQRAVTLAPQKAVYRLTLAQAYRAAGQPEKARDAAQAGLQMIAPTRAGEPATSTRRLLEAELE